MLLGTSDVSWETKYVFDIVEVSTDSIQKENKLPLC